MRIAIAAVTFILLVIVGAFVHIYTLKLIPLLSYAIDGYPPAEYRIRHDCRFASKELGAGVSYLIANRSAEGDDGGRFTSMIEILLECGLDPETEYAWSENPLDAALLNQDAPLSQHLVESGIKPSARFCRSMHSEDVAGVSESIVGLISRACTGRH